LFDIGTDAPRFLGITYPVVEGFVLPEFCAGTAKNEICFASRFAFDLPRDLRHGRKRRKQDVNVIEHYGISVNAKLIFVLAFLQGRDDTFRDAGIFEPDWTGTCDVESTIVVEELLA